MQVTGVTQGIPLIIAQNPGTKFTYAIIMENFDVASTLE